MFNVQEHIKSHIKYNIFFFATTTTIHMCTKHYIILLWECNIAAQWQQHQHQQHHFIITQNRWGTWNGQDSAKATWAMEKQGIKWKLHIKWHIQLIAMYRCHVPVINVLLVFLSLHHQLIQSTDTVLAVYVCSKLFFYLLIWNL